MSSQRHPGLRHVSQTIPATLSEEETLAAVRELLSSALPDLAVASVAFLRGGLTNRLLRAQGTEGGEERLVAVKIFGLNSELTVDRSAELHAMAALSEKGCGQKLYASFENGLVYEFLPGRVLDVESVRRPSVYRAVAREMGRLHRSLPAPPGAEPIFRSKTLDWIHQLPDSFPSAKRQKRFVEEFPRRSELLRELELWSGELERLGSPLVLCHNDLNLPNVLLRDAPKDQTDQDPEAKKRKAEEEEEVRVAFIDWEFAGPNYAACDVGEQWGEWGGTEEPVDFARYPPDDAQRDWLRAYAQAYASGQDGGRTAQISEEELGALVRAGTVGAAAAHFFWAVWAVVQAHVSKVSYDFLDYGITRMKEYYRLKKKLLEA